jgi:hypothetical protein
MTIETSRTKKRSPSRLPLMGLLSLPVGLLKALRRRLVPALTLGLILAAIAGTTTWFLMPPPKITAQTQLHVTADKPNLLFPEKSPFDIEEFRSKQAFLIRDRFVLNAALRNHPGLAQTSLLKDQSDPLQWLEKELKVESPSPEFIHISLSGDQPDELTKIVTAVTESYLDNVVDREGNARRQELNKLREIHDQFIRRTQNKRRRIRDLQRNVGPIDEKNLVIQQQIDLENLREAKKELAKVHSDLRKLRIELGINPDWVKEVWPAYMVSLNCLPGSSLPINNAIVLLLHDDRYLLHRAEQEHRHEKLREELRFLEEMNGALGKEATDLDKRLQQTRRDAADLVEKRWNLTGKRGFGRRPTKEF